MVLLVIVFETERSVCILKWFLYVYFYNDVRAVVWKHWNVILPSASSDLVLFASPLPMPLPAWPSRPDVFPRQKGAARDSGTAKKKDKRWLSMAESVYDRVLPGHGVNHYFCTVIGIWNRSCDKPGFWFRSLLLLKCVVTSDFLSQSVIWKDNELYKFKENKSAYMSFAIPHRH